MIRPGVGLPLGDDVENLVEGMHVVGEAVTQQEPQRQERGGQFAGDGNGAGRSASRARAGMRETTIGP